MRSPHYDPSLEPTFGCKVKFEKNTKKSSKEERERGEQTKRESGPNVYIDVAGKRKFFFHFFRVSNSHAGTGTDIP